MHYLSIAGMAETYVRICADGAYMGVCIRKIFPLCVCMASVSVMPRWVSDSRPWRPPLCLNTTLQGIWFLITLQTQINACIELWLMRRHFPRFFRVERPRRRAKRWKQPIGDRNNCFPGTCAFCAYARLLISRTSTLMNPLLFTTK
jgi:hypothetical protein